MIPKNVVKTDDVMIAATMMSVSGSDNNSTKFDVLFNLNGKLHRIAPKALISKSFEMAGSSLPVSLFSGGAESNKFLGNFGIRVVSKDYVAST